MFARNLLFFPLVFLTMCLSACNYRTDISLDFPTPPPAPLATPLAKLELARDSELEARLAKIAESAKGKVGVAAVVIETGNAAMLNASQKFPMQSVYKLPISMAVMEQVRQSKIDLDEQIGVTVADMVRKGQRSPLRDQNPNGGEFAVRELIKLALVESDGTASDVLLRIAGGPSEVQSFLTQIGIREIKVVNTEKEIGQNWQTQYENSATPTAAIELLRWLETSARIGVEIDRVDPSADEQLGYSVITQFMADSVPGANRLKGLLPKGTVVAHKTGTGGTQNGITGATNDIGIIDLPNGKHLAVAVFISDSSADETAREAVIARIAKAAWDRWSK